MLIKEYWNLIGQEPFLAITWEPAFSQACNFCRMLMNHKNFHFTQIPDKTIDIIFLKVQKPCFWVVFDHFRSFLPNGDFFQKIRLCHTHSVTIGSVTHYLFASNTMLSFRKKLMSQSQENLWTGGRTDGQTLFYRTLPAEAGGPKILLHHYPLLIFPQN